MISCEVLGQAGRDNAMLVRVDSGQAVERLLFDCGEGCLDGVSPSEGQAIDALMFSHLHMDHVAGFDTFFRRTYDRTSKPNRIYGPPGAAAILQHRFQGFLWNLVEGRSATWYVSEIEPSLLRTARFELAEGFAIRHGEPIHEHAGVVYEGAGCSVEALAMEHLGACLAYVVRGRPRLNVDPSRLAATGLAPGPWLKAVKEPAEGEPEHVEVAGRPYGLAQLRERLLVETPGDAVAYLTDFLLDERAMERIVPFVRGCRTIVCEAQYRVEDAELARQNHHMTSVGAAALARDAGAGELVLIHVSERYRPDGWAGLLDEARAIFPGARYPEPWGLSAPRTPSPAR